MVTYLLTKESRQLLIQIVIHRRSFVFLLLFRLFDFLLDNATIPLLFLQKHFCDTTAETI